MRILTFIIGLIFTLKVSAQVDQKLLFAQYNVENLFDYVNDPNKMDEEFLPSSKLEWNKDKYQAKLLNISKVLASMNDGKGPDFVTFCEVENAKVLKDLFKTPLLKSSKYDVVHFEGPDVRSIDVALGYKKGVFKPYKSVPYTVSLSYEQSFKTRYVLLVSGIVNGKDTLHVLANHWPSRRGGQEESNEKRMAAALVAKHITDSLFARNPFASIVVAGDFNDEPEDKSLLEGLKASTKESFSPNYLYNLFYNQSMKGVGSHCYKNEWSMLDQIIVSGAMLSPLSRIYVDLTSAAVYSQPWMLESDPKFSGQPFRTYVGQRYLGGYSDHLPVVVNIFVKK